MEFIPQKPETEWITARIPVAVKRDVERAARGEHRTVTSVVIVALEEWLARHAAAKQAPGGR